VAKRRKNTGQGQVWKVAQAQGTRIIAMAIMCDAFFDPGNDLCHFLVQTHLILTATQRDRYYYLPCFQVKKQAQQECSSDEWLTPKSVTLKEPRGPKDKDKMPCVWKASDVLLL
jgi:hypothetical protein